MGKGENADECSTRIFIVLVVLVVEFCSIFKFSSLLKLFVILLIYGLKFFDIKHCDVNISAFTYFKAPSCFVTLNLENFC